MSRKQANYLDLVKDLEGTQLGKEWAISGKSMDTLKARELRLRYRGGIECWHGKCCNNVGSKLGT